jgi:G6PDH family F420-dependent oxidoreductase
VSSEHYSPWCTSQGHAPDAWPPVAQRQDMLAEAITIIRELHTADLVTWQGDYFRIDSTRIRDLPDQAVPTVAAVPGEKSIARFAPPGYHLITTEPRAELLASWAKVHDGPSHSTGQIPICRGADKDAAIAMAHDQFRWFGGGWAVDTDLPTPAGFEAVSQFVRSEDVAESIPCGPDPDELADAVREYAAAGFTDVTPVQVGAAHQQRLLDEAAGPLLEKLPG